MAQLKNILKGFGVLTAGLIAAGAVPLGAVSAQDSLREIRARENEERALAREVSYTESICGSSISASIDWRASRGWPEGTSLVASCDGALGALEAICRSDRSRGSRVTSFTCAGDGRGASLSGGSLRYGASPGDNGFADTKALLDSKL